MIAGGVSRGVWTAFVCGRAGHGRTYGEALLAAALAAMSRKPQTKARA